MGRSTTATGVVLGFVLGMSGIGMSASSPQLAGPLVQTAVPVSAVRPIPPEPATAAQPIAVGIGDRVLRRWAGAGPADGRPAVDPELVAAYLAAESAAPDTCGVTAELLAAIGQVESGNAAGHTLDAHRVSPAIIGPALDGRHGRAAVADTDAGALDQDPVWDHAVGPLQLTPSRWRVAGVDLDGDGLRDPQNVFDAAGATMVHLCGGGRDLHQADQLAAAVLDYNPSPAYLRLVLAWKALFDTEGMWPDPMVEMFLARRVPLDSGPTFARTPRAHAHAAAEPEGHGTTPVQASGPVQLSDPVTPPPADSAVSPPSDPQPAPADQADAPPPADEGGAGPEPTQEPAQEPTQDPETCPPVPTDPTDPDAPSGDPTTQPEAADPGTDGDGDPADEDGSAQSDPCATPDAPTDPPTDAPTPTPAAAPAEAPAAPATSGSGDPAAAGAG